MEPGCIGTMSDVTSAGRGPTPTTCPAKAGELRQEGWAQVRTVGAVRPAGTRANGEVSPPSTRERPGRASHRERHGRSTAQAGRASHGRWPRRAEAAATADSLAIPVPPTRQKRCSPALLKRRSKPIVTGRTQTQPDGLLNLVPSRAGPEPAHRDAARTSPPARPASGYGGTPEQRAVGHGHRLPGSGGRRLPRVCALLS